MAKEYLYPTSDVDVNLDSSGGTNYGSVDEDKPDFGGTVVSTGLESEVYDIYGLSNPVNTEHVITFVRVWAYARKEDIIGNPLPFIKLKVKVGGTIYNGSSGFQTMQTGWRFYNDTWTVNPDTGNAWTWAEISSLEAGLGMYADFLAVTECTKFYVEVKYTLPTGETLRPTSDDSVALLTTDGGGVHYTEVDEATLDTADYVYRWENTSYAQDRFGIENSGVGDGTINSITLVMNCIGGQIAQSGFGRYKFFVDMGGSEYMRSEHRVNGRSYEYYSETWFTNPDTASAWTWTNIDDLKAGVALACSGTTNVFLITSQFYVIVDYVSAYRRRVILSGNKQKTPKEFPKEFLAKSLIASTTNEYII